MIYETNKASKGCVKATVIFIICILFGMLISCTKDIDIEPSNIGKACKKCTENNKRDTVKNQIIKK